MSQVTEMNTGRKWPSWCEPVGPSLMVVALMAANLIYRLVALRPGYFWQDDYYITAWAKFNPLGPDYLFLRFSDHFQPLGLAAAWVSQRLFPGSYSAAMTWTAVLYALSIWAMYRLLLSIFGWRPQIMLVLVFWGFSVFTLQSFLWYAASIYLAPYLLLLPVALLTAVRYVRTPSAMRLLLVFLSSVLVVAAHTFGLAVAALTALLIATGAIAGSSGVTWWRRLVAHWRLLVAQVLPGIAVLIYYVNRAADGKGVTVEPVQVLEYVGRQFAWVIIPGMAGGPWRYNTFLGPEFPFFTPLAGFMVIEFVVLLACLALVRRRAFWVWMGALVLVGGQLAAVTLGRGGGDTATILRYSTPGLVALTLAISLTVMSPQDGHFRWERWGASLATAWRRWDPIARVLTVAVLIQAFVISFSISALTPIFETPFAFNRVYVENLVASAQQVPEGLALIPQVAPNAVVPVAAPGPTSTELVLASQPTSPEFVDSLSGDLWGFTGEGSLVKQVVFGVEAVARPGEECLSLVRDQPVVVRLQKPTEYPFATLSVGTIAERESALRVDLLEEGEVSGSAVVTVLPGLQRSYAPLSGQGDSLRLVSEESQLICVTDAVVGERFHWDARWVQDGSSVPTQSFDLSRP